MHQVKSDNFGPSTQYEESPFVHLILAIVGFLRSEICSCVSSIVGTILIALFLSYNQIIPLIISIFLYLILVIGSAVVKRRDTIRVRHDCEKRADIEKHHKLVYKASESIRVINRDASNKLYKVARKIKRENWSPNIRDIRDNVGFQAAAFYVCQEIYKIISEKTGITKPYVTVYQRIESQQTSRKRKSPANTCKMIAYHNFESKEPLSYQTMYSIPSSTTAFSGNQIEYHTRIFSENSLEPRILMTKEEVEANFKHHKDCSFREGKISQYIGIPSNVCNRGVMFLVQIDCEEKNGLGSSKEEILSFIDDVLSQYISLLCLYYEIDRLNEVVSLHIDEMQRKYNSSLKNKNQNRRLGA